jgi:hypothetical protein
MYRAPPPTPPLVVTGDRNVQAFDSASGTPLWHHDLGSGLGRPRLASTAERLAIGFGRHAFLLEIHTGNVLLDMLLWFDVNAAIVEGETLVLAGTEGLACFGRDGYVWGVRSRPVSGGMFENKGEFWVENARGERVATLATFAPWGCSASSQGLVLGRSIFQPDIDT